MYVMFLLAAFLRCARLLNEQTRAFLVRSSRTIDACSCHLRGCEQKSHTDGVDLLLDSIEPRVSSPWEGCIRPISYLAYSRCNNRLSQHHHRACKHPCNRYGLAARQIHRRRFNQLAYLPIQSHTSETFDNLGKALAGHGLGPRLKWALRAQLVLFFLQQGWVIMALLALWLFLYVTGLSLNQMRFKKHIEQREVWWGLASVACLLILLTRFGVGNKGELAIIGIVAAALAAVMLEQMQRSRQLLTPDQ